MRWAVHMLVLVLLLGVLGGGTGVELVVREDACEQGCPDDDGGHNCPPLCPGCACWVRSAPALLVESLAPTILPLDGARVSFPDEERTPPAPEPREILHVPI